MSTLNQIRSAEIFAIALNRGTGRLWSIKLGSGPLRISPGQRVA